MLCRFCSCVNRIKCRELLLFLRRKCTARSCLQNFVVLPSFAGT